MKIEEVQKAIDLIDSLVSAAEDAGYHLEVDVFLQGHRHHRVVLDHHYQIDNGTIGTIQYEQLWGNDFQFKVNGLVLHRMIDSPIENSDVKELRFYLTDRSGPSGRIIADLRMYIDLINSIDIRMQTCIMEVRE